ncbi:TonB-dependent receptor [Mucilaginibacter sp. Bleaf8]|uniref:SusC/RagA family TonB-linked outer membrane protein n=1 Tax=Mucilaginibacter sp. Bleaf8 TaxID=2834430 RepID=UPI001BD02ED4|nr:TonB-dependent receptor [Mucilaginibacter sp. Bleaf8]MBS7562953.1 TonB-dependent receptor [Mucilaginibacter sp. Bleaf8]
MKKHLHQRLGYTTCRPPCFSGNWRLLFNASFILSFLLLTLVGNPVLAQGTGTPITGRVTDATGQGLPGVTVRTKENATAATVTDVDGRYKITASAGSTLVFSFVGFTTQEVRVNDQKTIDVQLRDDAKSLNEVVVIGYQAVRKRDLTGAVSTVSPAEASRTTANSVGESLQGLTPGVTVRSSGAPGQQSNIEIRGVASFISSAPLYVVDGMILEDPNTTTVNPQDIESIQVLKDASAAAIYGSRAANGVIIITTRKGKKGAPKISVSAKYGSQHIPKRWDVMNSTEYADTRRQQYTNAGLTPPPSVSTEFNPAINTNWQDLAMRTGNNQDYNVSISGGSDNSSYLVSGSYFQNQGVLKGYSFNRASLRVNTETKKGRLTFGENALFTNTNNYHPNRGNPFYDLPQLLPTVPVQDPRFITPGSKTNPWGYSTGTLDNSDVTYAYNPVAVRDLSQGYNNYARLLGNGYAQLRLFDWLDYKLNVGLEASFDYNEDLRKDGIFSYAQQPELSYIDEDRQRFYNVLIEHTLNFNKTIGVHNINGVVGYTQQTFYRDQTQARKTNLQIYNGSYLTEINAATGTSSASGQVVRDDRLRSFLGRINYNYDDRYLLTASGRVDKDSRFGPDYRTGFFPSVALGWRLSKEKFFKVDWVDNLKINASYGVLGINTISSFQNVGLINISPRAVFNGDRLYTGAYQARLYNANVKWEERKETNIGFDASLFRDRLTISAAYYYNKSDDVLINRVLPLISGNAGGDYPAGDYRNFPPENAASISNRGFEFEATYRNNDNPFKWSVSGNFTTIKNKVLSIGNQGVGINYIQQGSARSQVGYPMGQWYVLKELGIFQSQEEVNNYKRSDGSLIQPFSKPGDIKFGADPNGKGTINNNDRVYNGSPWPTLQTGLQFNGSYKQFSVNLQMVGIFGVTLYNDVRRVLDSYQNTNFRQGINPWSPTNTGGTDPRLGIANGDTGIATNNTPESSRWLENGSYGRIRNLEIGYMLPKSLLGKLRLESARVFVSGQNLLTVTSYKGLDPDVTGNGILQRGVDAGQWPSNRIFSIGLNCGF